MLNADTDYRSKAERLADTLDWGTPDCLARDAAGELRRLHAITQSPSAPKLDQFFYRFSDLGMRPGNKTAGFDFIVATAALQQLIRIPLPAEQQARIVDLARQRLAQSSLVGKRLAKQCGIAFWGETACPRFFTGFAGIGGSIGACPEALFDLARKPEDPRSNLAIMPSETIYSPHNVDSPQEAFCHVMLAQAWAECASDLLALRAHERAPAPPVVPNSSAPLMPEETGRTLKPCPFCGGDKLLVMAPTSQNPCDHEVGDCAYPQVVCTTIGCNARAGGANWDHSCDSAIERWNARPQTTKF